MVMGNLILGLIAIIWGVFVIRSERHRDSFTTHCLK